MKVEEKIEIRADESGAMKKTYLKLSLVLFGVFLFCQLLAFGLRYLCATFWMDLYLSPYFIFALTVVVSYGIEVPLVALFLRKIPAQRPSGEPMRPGSRPIAFMIGLFAMIGGSLVGNALMAIVNAIFHTGMETSPVTDAVSEAPLWITFPVVCLLGPLMEELLYRKLILDRVTVFGEKQAILFSALAFGLAHGNFFQAIGAFAAGLVFAYLYVRTGSIRTGLIFHIIINSFSTMISFFMGNEKNYFMLGEFVFAYL
ncbi:MAG: CPBP family intramembrane metalloprotease, partial [Clostridia bacterium]|nr:CPBP family intramembrane metalloprotease [Clostridia bacterium]